MTTIRDDHSGNSRHGNSRNGGPGSEDNPTEQHKRAARVCGIERQARQPQPSILAEFSAFLLHNKKWWLVPIFVVLLLLGVLAALGSSGVAPFIYTLF
jgi:hypothetical protein